MLGFQSLVVDLEELDIESELGIGGDGPTRGASGAVPELSYVYTRWRVAWCEEPGDRYQIPYTVCPHLSPPT